MKCIGKVWVVWIVCGVVGISLSFAKRLPESSGPIELKQLDPHGLKNYNLSSGLVHEHSECKVCHVLEKGKLATKSKIHAICLSCHGALPHSGVGEHLRDPKLNCLSCHFSHRSDIKQDLAVEESGFPVLKRSSFELPTGFVDRPRPSALLRKRCEDCHTWR